VPLSGVAAGDCTGCSAAMLGAFAVVGACDATNEGRAQAGVVHVLRVASQDASRGATSHVVPPDAAASARFGHALAMSTFRGSGLLLCGAPGEGAGYATAVGFVYVFTFPLSQPPSGATAVTAFTHTYVRRFAAEPAAQDQRFGSAIAVLGERVAVGAPGPLAYPGGYQTIDGAGSVYVFDLYTGDQVGAATRVRRMTHLPAAPAPYLYAVPHHSLTPSFRCALCACACLRRVRACRVRVLTPCACLPRVRAYAVCVLAPCACLRRVHTGCQATATRFERRRAASRMLLVRTHHTRYEVTRSSSLIAHEHR
jgi:hypothetical protein